MRIDAFHTLGGALLALLALGPTHAPAQTTPTCAVAAPETLRRNPTEREQRCRYGALGPGRFGLLSYADVPVYQPATPMPGTHVVGVAGHARPAPGESYERWEWRTLRTAFGAEARVVHRSLELLDPIVASRILRFEQRLREEGVRFSRRETWRSPERQAFLFQQGRSRPGPLATSTLTSWHSAVDARGRPAARAVDYDLAPRHLSTFHRVAGELGLVSFGVDSFDTGHVFLPQAPPEQELILLRLLPRVPEVTLGTGLPVDRPLPSGGREALRAAAEEFARSEFLAVPEPALASAGPTGLPITRLHDHARFTPPFESGAVNAAEAVRPEADGGGAPGARRRSAAPSREGGGRNRGG